MNGSAPAAAPLCATAPARHGMTICVTLRSKKQKPRQPVAFCESGGSGEIRTRDQRIKSPLLYRLSYRPVDRAGPYPRKPEIIAEAARRGKEARRLLLAGQASGAVARTLMRPFAAIDTRSGRPRQPARNPGVAGGRRRSDRRRGRRRRPGSS